MVIKGYKAINNDCSNRYGFKFEVGKTYFKDGEIKFGNNGNGFHLCLNIEDTLRYFDFFNERCLICEVEGSGEVKEFEDTYNDYYDMYVVSNIKITKIMSRKDILDEVLKSLNEIRICRFISGYKLTSNEIRKIIKKYYNNPTILKYIDYYQLGYKDAFSKTI
jgi:hypothetical protein